MIATLRTLTKKSKIGFGEKWATYTVQEMIDLGKTKALIYYYFKYTNISYKNELLNEFGITDEWKIDKPGSDPDKFKDFCFKKEGKKPYFRRRNLTGGFKGKNYNRSLINKEKLMRKNHGH